MTLAMKHGQGLMQVKDIAQENNISLQYLVQIFNLLVKAEIISSVRGKNGGYKLSRPPAAITVLQILETLEGEIEFTRKTKGKPDAVDELLLAAEVKLREVFNVSLAELMVHQEKMDHVLMFDI